MKNKQAENTEMNNAFYQSPMFQHLHMLQVLLHEQSDSHLALCDKKRINTKKCEISEEILFNFALTFLQQDAESLNAFWKWIFVGVL